MMKFVLGFALLGVTHATTVSSCYGEADFANATAFAAAPGSWVAAPCIGPKNTVCQMIEKDDNGTKTYKAGCSANTEAACNTELQAMYTTATGVTYKHFCCSNAANCATTATVVTNPKSSAMASSGIFAITVAVIAALL